MKEYEKDYDDARSLLCCAMTTTVVNAQEAESPIKEGERLAKAADDAPQDWRKQFDAGFGSIVSHCRIGGAVRAVVSSGPNAIDAISHTDDCIKVIELRKIVFPIRRSCRDFLGN